MANFEQLISKTFRPRIQSFIDDWKARADKDNFKYSGMQMFTGMQGGGKTITAVRFLGRLKSQYHKAFVVSNLKLFYLKQISIAGYKIRFEKAYAEATNLRDEFVAKIETKPDGYIEPDVYEFWVPFTKPNEYLFFEDTEEASWCLTHVNNGKYGVVYLIDEIHTYWNALDSKNIPMFIFTEISQQRKQHKTILATSQVFMRMAKAFREQCDNVIMCHTMLGILTVTRAYNGAALSRDGKEDSEVHMKKSGWYFHTRELRNAYDTFQKVVSGAEQYESQSTSFTVASPRRASRKGDTVINSK
jgi:hypothetical protein